MTSGRVQENYIPVPNEFDRALWEVSRVHGAVQSAGGLIEACFPHRKTYKQPPHLIMPANGIPFQRVQTIALPAANGNDYTVLTLDVPQGHRGVITSVAHGYTGSGFVEGSGDLTWRIRVGLTWARDMGDMKVQLGSLQTPYQIYRGGIMLSDSQRLLYIVNHAVGSALVGGRIFCAVFGWFYPTS